jgi:acetyl-CoA acyltransferase
MDTSRAGSVRRVERPYHPVAPTGARMLMTLVHERRRRGGGLGVAAMCAGGGMGSAAVSEVPAP